MKVSELIEALEEYVEEHGDQDVEDEYGEEIQEPQEVQGACILAEKA